MRASYHCIRALTAALAFSASAVVMAHYPTMDCQRQHNRLECKVGYSDGSSASGETVKLYSYDDELLYSQQADERSIARFPFPEGEFYISFNPGHDQPAEVDYIELD